MLRSRSSFSHSRVDASALEARLAGSRTRDRNQHSTQTPSRAVVSKKRPLIVALAVSAARFEAIEGFFKYMPPTDEFAFVLLPARPQGIDDGRYSRLKQASTLKFTTAEPDVSVSGGCVYLAPADAVITLAGGRFTVQKAGSAGDRQGIDSFITSLARVQKERAIAVAFDLPNGEGLLGMAAIKEQGGLAIAEEKSSATADGSAAAIADLVMPVERMPQGIIAYANFIKRSRLGEAGDTKETAASLARIEAVLLQKTGYDLQGYSHDFLVRRVQRRMQIAQMSDAERYIGCLQRDPDECRRLSNDLLTRVATFFPDCGRFEYLERKVIPKLFERKASGVPLRIWVPGCSTGEEAYSIAILLCEQMAASGAERPVQIFATDMNDRAIDAARKGCYFKAALGGMSEERVGRWFTRMGDAFCVAKEPRDMCIFCPHNLLKDAPLSRLDLIVCRNSLTHLESSLAERVFPLFHFALRPGGFLFLGSPENLGWHSGLFTRIDRRLGIFKRMDTQSRVRPAFPLLAGRGPRFRMASQPSQPTGDLFAKYTERVAGEYAPNYVVIDRDYAVLAVSGEAKQFMKQTEGAARPNLLDLIHIDLRSHLRTALHKASLHRQPVHVEGLEIRQNRTTAAVNLAVEPVRSAPERSLNFIVIFKDSNVISSREAGEATYRCKKQIRHLESELRLTKDCLQVTIEELQNTNEKLRSSNEEYQSVNEELEASKEELQSVNEELHTVNGELGHRVADLARANSDLKHLLESTQIATVFLDSDLKIRNFTPAVSEIFQLIDSDLHRPISDIAAQIDYVDLLEDVRTVLRTSQIIERQVESKINGKHYLARILPTPGDDNCNAGAVLTFLDVTATFQVERALRASDERFRLMAETVPALLFTARLAHEFDYVNRRFTDYTGLSEEEALGSGWMAALHKEEAEANQERWLHTIAEGKPLEQDVRLRNKDGDYRWFTMRAEPVRDPGGEVTRWFGYFVDIHERRLAEDRQKLLARELQHRVRNILSVVRTVTRRTAESAPSIEDFVAHFDGRIEALARTQNILTRTPQGGVDLRELVTEEVLSQATQDDSRLVIKGPTVRLKQQGAELLGLALHELATNAFKYGALSKLTGQLMVSWRVNSGENGRRLILEWRESGVPILKKPERRGFGREILERGLVYELSAKTNLEFTNDGLRCIIDLPLPEG